MLPHPISSEGWKMGLLFIVQKTSHTASAAGVQRRVKAVLVPAFMELCLVHISEICLLFLPLSGLPILHLEAPQLACWAPALGSLPSTVNAPAKGASPAAFPRI